MVPDHYKGLNFEAEAQNQIADEWVTDLLWASELLQGVMIERDPDRVPDRHQLMVMASFFLMHLHSPMVQGRIAAWAAERTREEQGATGND